jgi:23S rRNA pseudouridine1911/1915/1917 synthase
LASATVDATGAGARLDQFVACLMGVSVHAARRLIAGGQVTVGVVVSAVPHEGEARAVRTKGLHLVLGQQVVVAQPTGAAAGAVIPEPDAPLAILYSDADLVVMNKAAGQPSHPLRAGERGTLANALVARFPECADAGDDPREAGLGHRLDHGTSGVLIAARRHQVWLALRAALKAATCEKTYLAEVVGQPPPRGDLHQPIGRRGRHGSRVVVGDQGRNPLSASTTWEVIEVRSSSALLRVRLHAGRAHQVRAHLAAAGHPLVGDALYGGDASGSVLAATEPARLHAESVRLPHAVSSAREAPLFFAAPPPEWAKIRSR